MARSLLHLLGELGITNDWPLCDRVTSLLASSYSRRDPDAAETPFRPSWGDAAGACGWVARKPSIAGLETGITRGPNLRRPFLGAVIWTGSKVGHGAPCTFKPVS